MPRWAQRPLRSALLRLPPPGERPSHSRAVTTTTRIYQPPLRAHSRHCRHCPGACRVVTSRHFCTRAVLKAMRACRPSSRGRPRIDGRRRGSLAVGRSVTSAAICRPNEAHTALTSSGHQERLPPRSGAAAGGRRRPPRVLTGCLPADLG